MAKNVYEDFLRLAGFEEHEMSKYLPEWRRASERLRLTEDDVRFAVEEWIPTNYEVKLEGVRKLIGGYIRELIDLTKANEYKERGVKVVYGILPAISHYYYALKLTAPDKVYVSFPDLFLVESLQAFFRKVGPYLEEAERAGIPYGCRHCALNKMRYAARRMGIIPTPDVAWSWGFICDEATKTDEFIRLYYDPNWKEYITRMPHDQPLGTIEDEVIERVEYLANQMRDGFEHVQKETGIKVPDAKIIEVRNIWHRYAAKLTELALLMASDPQPLSGEMIGFAYEPLATPFNTGIESMENAIDILIKELKQRVAKKEGILPEGAPKLVFYVLPFSNPWILKMFEENGVGVPVSLMKVLAKKELKPPTFDDPYMATAEAWLRRGKTVNLGYEAEVLCEKIQTYQPDGVVFGFWDFDRWWGSHQRILARIIEEKTKLPTFYIEGDIWEDRDYSPEALRTKIESICEIMKMRKA